jgi:type I restriction enzyme M protein
MVRIAQVNMYLHQFKNPQIFQYDSLTNEDRWNEKFDVILANPPFMSPKGGIKPHNKFGVASNRSEVLFVDYIINHLRPKGRAGIIVPEGIIFQSGKAYKELRKNLVENGLYAVVSLPGGVFQPYSGVKTSILFFDNELAKQKSEVVFIKISADGYDLGASKRAVAENDLPAAAELLRTWILGGQSENPIASFVTKVAIATKGDYNLSGERYREATDFLGSNWPVELLSSLEDSGVLKLGRGQIISKTDLIESPGIYPVYSSSAQGIGEFGQYGKYLFDEEMITWSVDGGGRFFYRPQHKFSVTNVSGWLRILEKEKLDAKFLFYVLENQWKTKEFNYVSKAHPSVIREMYKIPLPPIDVQKQIVSELDGYTSIISGAKQIVENWKPRIDIDPEWPLMKLEDVAKWTSGGTPKAGALEYYDGDIPWSVIGDLNEDVVSVTKEKITEKGLKESSAKVQPKGTVMLAMYGASIGKTGIMGIPMATNQAIACGQVNSGIMSELFLLYYLQSQKSEFVRAGAGGAQPNISQGIVKEWPVPVPAIEVQHEILSSIAEEKTQIDSAKKLIETYEARTKTVIAKLWSE